ncbi:hypothetical protein MMC10_011218 [Thelotrema lepadinum]|nr:hypothetical protein [Thelotrema lepadinum]
MRLLEILPNGDFRLTKKLLDDTIPQYAILSHTWGNESEEVMFEDMIGGTGREKAGSRKIKFCGEQAASDGLQYFWAFQESKWFTRGWTLQELLAPSSVEFFSQESIRLGDKQSLEQQIHEITGIPSLALRGLPLSQFTTEQKFGWVENRETTRAEDWAYCLLGIFEISMPVIYGERRSNAIRRLKNEIDDASKAKVQGSKIPMNGTTQPPKSQAFDLPLNEERRKLLMERLSFDQAESRRATIKKAHLRTCKWLLQQSEFRDWRDWSKVSENHGFLWIKGKPGTGKSTLMKFTLEHIEKTLSKESIVISVRG